MSTLLSAKTESASAVNQAHTNDVPDWPALPTETEIYILPDGQVIVADLPVELAEFLLAFGQRLSCHIDAPATEIVESVPSRLYPINLNNK